MTQANTMMTSEHKHGTQARGRVKTVKHDYEFLLIPIAGRQIDKAPTHDLEVITEDGEAVPAGAAWAKMIERGESAGKTLYSMSFNDPDLPEWSFAAFPVPGQDSQYVVRTDRRRS